VSSPSADDEVVGGWPRLLVAAIVEFLLDHMNTNSQCQKPW